MCARRIACLIVTVLLNCLATLAGAGEATVIVPGSQWMNCGPDIYDRCQDFDVDLGFGISAIDSVWIEITGVSDVGDVYLGPSPQDCWDAIMASFISESGAPECAWEYDPYPYVKSVIGCVCAPFCPRGESQPFSMSARIVETDAGMVDHLVEFVTVNRDVDFGSVFFDGTAVLRLRRLDGGFGGLRCLYGLASVSQVTVHVAYNDALPTRGMTWGTVKALHR